MLAGSRYLSNSDAHHQTAATTHAMTTAMTTTVTSQPPPPPPPPCQPPQNMSCSLSSTSANAPRSSRPKLTLQTACVPRSFGKSNTGLSLSFASDPTASPTVRNTFKNAYDVPLPSVPPLSPAKTSVNKLYKPAARFAPSNNNITTTTTTTTTTNNNPYQLPLGVKSILLNSPLDAPSRRRSVSVAANGANSGSGAPRRVFFPAKKQVSYRYPLEEEIRTVHFTARHSDLDAEPESEVHKNANDESASDEDSDSSSNQSNSDTSTSDDDITDGVATPSKFERKKRKILGTERQIRAVALMDGLDGEGDAYGSSSMTPQTPQCRTKRRREWKWTLGPLRPRHDVMNDIVTTVPQLQPPPPASNGPGTTGSVMVAHDEVGEKATTKSTDKKDSHTANNADLIIPPSISFAKFSGFSSFSIDPSTRPDDETGNKS